MLYYNVTLYVGGMTAANAKAGKQLVCDALAALGHSYDGTGGWHILPAVTADRRLGFVNIAAGVAVTTTITVPRAIVAALTVADQKPGPLFSGAAKWAAPDPGEAARAEFPAGWLQLAVDVRHSAEPVSSPRPIELAAKVTSWCLTTCYGERGEPGAAALDKISPGLARHGKPAVRADRLVLDWWYRDTDGNVAAMRATAQEALDSITEQVVGRHAGQHAEHAEPRDGAASFASIEAPRLTRYLRRLEELATASLGPVRVPVPVTWSVLTKTVQTVLAARMLPLIEALAAELPPLVQENGARSQAARVLLAQRNALVHHVLPLIEENILSEAEDQAATAIAAAFAAFHGDAAVDTRIRVWEAQYEKWGISDVAGYLGVAAETVAGYRSRGQMPEAAGMSGRSPWWWRTAVEAWRPKPAYGEDAYWED
uniref:helix-turn-helix transcriptional regulator n=1 Tax=Amycolatopsis sp. CA-096443 TaxID=3239919 RepID=UPI003F496990